jgi:CMP-2-keto-3-deoxyoctulosonic acid synthetase
VRKILGILAYSSSFLDEYITLQRTPLEIVESVDQSRIIEHDITLRGVEFSKGYPGINEPREVKSVEKYLDQDPSQKVVLEQLLRT